MVTGTAFLSHPMSILLETIAYFSHSCTKYYCVAVSGILVGIISVYIFHEFLDHYRGSHFSCYASSQWKAAWVFYNTIYAGCELRLYDYSVYFICCILWILPIFLVYFCTLGCIFCASYTDISVFWSVLISAKRINVFGCLFSTQTILPFIFKSCLFVWNNVWIPIWISAPESLWCKALRRLVCITPANCYCIWPPIKLNSSRPPQALLILVWVCNNKTWRRT